MVEMLNPFVAIVFRAAARRACTEQGLVLRALGIPFEIGRDGEGFFVGVPPEYAQTALDELGMYEEENEDWPPRFDNPPLMSRGKFAVGVYATLLILMHPIGQNGLFGRNFWDAGMMRAELVRSGEWWRAVTALTLHSDLPHLGGNIVFGALFAVLAGHALGAGLTWWLGLLAGTLGNYANAWLQEPSHSSIGASTAVFGLLGASTAYEWLRRHALNYAPMRRFAPLAGGAVLLGYLGTAGENTDVMAHVTGLGSGLLLGAIVSLARLPERLSPTVQRVLGALTLGGLVLSWLLAMR